MSPTHAVHVGLPQSKIDPDKVLDKYNSEIKTIKNKIRKRPG